VKVNSHANVDTGKPNALSNRMRRVVSLPHRSEDLLCKLVPESAPSVPEFFVQLLATNQSTGKPLQHEPKVSEATSVFVLWAVAADWADSLTDDDLAGVRRTHTGRNGHRTSDCRHCPVGKAIAWSLGRCYRVLTPNDVISGEFTIVPPTRSARGQPVELRNPNKRVWGRGTAL